MGLFDGLFGRPAPAAFSPAQQAVIATAQRYIQIINESLALVANSRDPDTRVSRLDLAKRTIADVTALAVANPFVKLTSIAEVNRDIGRFEEELGQSARPPLADGRYKNLEPGFGTATPGKRSSLEWILEGSAIDVAGRPVRGGMLYSGHSAPAANGHGIEPSLIDPSLSVDWERPEWSGSGMTYWPSYHSISPQCRAAYLSWLNSGRADPGAYIGYVFLYFYGLERRILVDAKLEGGHPDMPLVAAEVDRLLTIYSENGSFRSYALRFVDLIKSTLTVASRPAPPDWKSVQGTGEVPLAVRVGLGHYVAAGQPIPAEWALVLLRTQPENGLRVPAIRCAAEFDELFRRRYRAKFNEGMSIRAPRATIDVWYRPASLGFGGAQRVRFGDLPDVSRITGPMNKVRELGVECGDALGAYSRFLGRSPESAGTLAAASLLPDDLLETHGGPSVAALRDWAGQLFTDRQIVTAPMDEIVARWSPVSPTEFNKADAVAMAGLLAKLGVGIEPDVRFGGATPKPGSTAVVFSLPPGATSAPSPQYAAATLLVHLCAALVSVDGRVTQDERLHLATHLETTLRLEAVERDRLSAHLEWLLARKAGITGLKRRVGGLTAEQRGAVGRFLVNIAAADGVVSPDEIRSLTKIYKLLGIDEAEVYSAIHALGTGDTGPVPVRGGDTADPRWAIPAPPPKPGSPIRLDLAKVKARLADTAIVTALLASIFSEDADVAGQPTPPIEVPVPATPGAVAGAARVGGLDAAHAALAVRLSARPMWSRADAEDLSAKLGLPLLEGAIDRINEAAIEACGEPLIDGEDSLEINEYAAKELL